MPLMNRLRPAPVRRWCNSTEPWDNSAADLLAVAGRPELSMMLGMKPRLLHAAADVAAVSSVNDGQRQLFPVHESTAEVAGLQVCW